MKSNEVHELTEEISDFKKELKEDISVQMSGERSELAVQRTILVNSRTFSAWIRTGLSSVLAGLSIVNFIEGAESFHEFVLLTGLLFVLIGIIIYIMAYISYRKSYDMLEHKEAKSSVSLTFLLFVTSGMTLTAILIAALLILL